MTFPLAAALLLASSSVSYRTIATNECRRVAEVSDSAMGVCLEGKHLYVIGGGTLFALDVTDPANPVLAGSLPGMDNNRQIAVSDGFAYVVSRETGMRIVDVADPTNPRCCVRTHCPAIPTLRRSGMDAPLFPQDTRGSFSKGCRNRNFSIIHNENRRK